MSRWIRTVMADAGIDTITFKSHSTRTASTSKAKARNVDMSSIMKAASWSDTCTFYNFYYKPVALRQFGQIILSAP